MAPFLLTLYENVFFMETVSGVSADGSVFAGLGTHNGQFESWVVTIPTPGTLSGLALVAVVASRRRR